MWTGVHCAACRRLPTGHVFCGHHCDWDNGTIGREKCQQDLSILLNPPQQLVEPRLSRVCTATNFGLNWHAMPAVWQSCRLQVLSSCSSFVSSLSSAPRLQRPAGQGQEASRCRMLRAQGSR